MDGSHPNQINQRLHYSAKEQKALTPEVPLLGRALHVVRRLHDGDIQILQIKAIIRTENHNKVGAFNGLKSIDIFNLQGDRSNKQNRVRLQCRQCVRWEDGRAGLIITLYSLLKLARPTLVESLRAP